MTRKLPLFFFSPTLCWIDDNQLFLNAANNLFKNNYNCLTFTDAQTALEFLTSYKSLFSQINFTREFTESDIFDIHNHLPVDINISEITQLSNNPARKNELAVLIIDNNMPNMSGIDLCYHLKDFPYKKILLTGDTDQSKIIDAFNQGIIDRFIAKEDTNVTHKLQTTIHELSYQYFYEKTKNLLCHLETSRPSPLSDPIFVNFFLQWCEQNKTHEFYLLNRHGSFLVKINSNTNDYFIVMSEFAKNEFIKLNDEVPIESKSLVDQVAEGKLLPFFGVGKESWEFDYTEWQKYFYPANVLQGKEKYYWTVIKNQEL